MNNIIKTFILLFFISIGIIHLKAESTPFASISSHWNYWMATEYSYGFHTYTVVKDTTITAPMFETNESKTAIASWIEKRTYSTMHSGGSSEGAYAGAFAAYREGNKSYVWDSRTKKWFKWVDMDAKPGDKWVVPEIISGKGLYDYVEVSFLDTTQIGDQKIPLLYLIPSCTSRYTTKKDFTSRLSMAGYYNIDYLALNNTPEPRPNGYVYTQPGGPAEIVDGLICAKVNNIYLSTNRLEEYVKYNNKPYYDQGIIDCDSLKAPIVDGNNSPLQSLMSNKLRPGLPENITIHDFSVESSSTDIKEGSGNSTGKKVPTGKSDLSSTDTILIPVVVHVIHNTETPEEKIDISQIKTMIDALNAAYSDTHEEKVRDTFKPVIGNPYIKFELAIKGPQGNLTTGVIYYETKKDYYELPSTSDIKVRYAFKFNDDGSSRNWDHTKYANIYVVDLGGFDGKKNVGGFVTNPEYKNTEEFELFKKWILEADTEFWDNWLKSEEGALLDGLTVDTWYTFGGKSNANPKSTFNTAIHELGHYLGLKHVSLQIIQNNDGSLTTHDDGFDDTPLTHYNQYALIPCGRDIYQCGNLVQTENYMDYSLECACMFTQQQAAFMRNFISEVRTSFIDNGTNIESDKSEQINVYPNPAKDVLYIQGNFRKARIMDVTGKQIRSLSPGESSINVAELNTGIFFIQFYLDNGEIQTRKIIIEG